MKKFKSVEEHYKEEAKKHGTSKLSTMEDIIIRDKEIDLINNFISALSCRHKNKKLKILDLGCGNGYTLSIISGSSSKHTYWGLDQSDELINLARSRKLANCNYVKCDIRLNKFKDNMFDAVYTERCLINILHWKEQKLALGEVYRILKPGGYYLMIEGFSDGLANNNKAREECGLPPLKPVFHNLYFDKKKLFKYFDGKFVIQESTGQRPTKENYQIMDNFLSSHYFIARVLHPLITKGAQVKNTEFVKFFSFLPPIGNYSPLQAVLFKKINKR